MSTGELSDVLSRVRRIIPDVKIRVQRSYAWLMFVTLKVYINILLKKELKLYSTGFGSSTDKAANGKFVVGTLRKCDRP